ncbi:unnamed protein product, partial [Allacma fusca]
MPTTFTPRTELSIKEWKPASTTYEPSTLQSFNWVNSETTQKHLLFVTPAPSKTAHYLATTTAKLAKTKELMSTSNFVPTKEFPTKGWEVIESSTPKELPFHNKTESNDGNEIFGQKLSEGELTLTDKITVKEAKLWRALYRAFTLTNELAKQD